MAVLSAKLNPKGGVTIPAQIREQFGLEGGSVLMFRVEAGVIIITPAILVPIEQYDLRRKAEFILNNAIDSEDYARATKEVRKMGFDPDTIPHDKPG